MNAKSLLSLAKLAIANKWPLLVEGSPGIGKSEIIVQACKACGVDFMIAHPVTSDPTDYKGLPGIVNGKAEFLPYGELRRLIDATAPLVCFIDDLGQGSQATQAALMQLVLAREINGVKISDKVIFIAATNRRADNAGVSGLITPLRSRFRSTVELIADGKEVAAYLLSKGAPVEMCAFLSMCPEMVSTFDPKTAREGKPFACPRTWSFFADFLNANVDDSETLSGCVGEAPTVKFLGFRDWFRSVGNLPAQILTNPTTAPIPDKVDKQFAIAAAMVHHATVKNIDAIGLYFDRFDGMAEFRTFFWKAVTVKKPEIAQTNAHSNWFIKHGANDVC